jgi:hypothetical protein
MTFADSTLRWQRWVLAVMLLGSGALMVPGQYLTEPFMLPKVTFMTACALALVGLWLARTVQLRRTAVPCRRPPAPSWRCSCSWWPRRSCPTGPGRPWSATSRATPGCGPTWSTWWRWWPRCAWSTCAAGAPCCAPASWRSRWSPATAWCRRSALTQTSQGPVVAVAAVGTTLVVLLSERDHPVRRWVAQRRAAAVGALAALVLLVTGVAVGARSFLAAELDQALVERPQFSPGCPDGSRKRNRPLLVVLRRSR